MRQKGVFATKYDLIVRLAALNDETLVDFDTHFALHFIPQIHQLVIFDDADIELDDFAVRVVRIVATQHGLVVVNLLVSLAQELIKFIAIIPN